MAKQTETAPATRPARPADVRKRISETMQGIVRSQESRAKMGTTKSIGKRGVDVSAKVWDASYEARLARFRAIDEALAKL